MAPKPKKTSRFVLLGLAILAVVAIGGFVYLNGQLEAPKPDAKPFFIRYDAPRSLDLVLGDLQNQHVIQNAFATRIWAILSRHHTTVAIGTYRVGAEMNAKKVLQALVSPIHQNVRLPETNWAARTARLLERHDVCTATSYDDLVRAPQTFEGQVSFPLPAGSLEGYLLPDTYDLPPLLGAQAVVSRQLKAFDRKVYQPLGKPADIQRILTVASLIELEVARDNERPLVAAVIENRLRKKMRLQIDASVNYALQVWRPLKRSDLKEASGPYNLYTHNGLPPGQSAPPV